MPRGRPPADPQPPPSARELIAAGVAKEMATLAEVVGELRVARGWTRQQLAAAAGLNHAVVAGIEAGTRDPALSSLIKLQEVFGLPGLADLFPQRSKR